MFFAFIAIVGVAISAAHCESDLELAVANSVTKCAKSNNVLAVDLMKLRMADVDLASLSADAEKNGLKCFTKCVIDAHNLISADGVVDVDRVVDFSVAQGKDKDTSRAAAKRCSSGAANKSCDDSWRYYECFNKLH